MVIKFDTKYISKIDSEIEELEHKIKSLDAFVMSVNGGDIQKLPKMSVMELVYYNSCVSQIRAMEIYRHELLWRRQVLTEATKILSGKVEAHE